MKRFFRFVPTGVTSLIVVLVIAYLSLSSDPLGASHVHLFPGSDKVAHFLMYAVASMAFIIDYAKFRLPHHTRLNVDMAVTATTSCSTAWGHWPDSCSCALAVACTVSVG